MSTNSDVARALHELAALTELEETDRQSFRARAYHNAVRAIETETRDVTSLDVEELTSIKGIGPAIAKKVREYAETGTIAKLEQLRDRYPPGYVELVRVPGLGPKTVALLYEHLDVRTVDDLKAAIAEERLRDVPGLGARTEEKLAREIQRLGLAGKHRRIPIAEALPVAVRIVELLSAAPGVHEAAYAGSLRRFRESVADLDIVVAAEEAAPVMDAFVSMAIASEVEARGETKAVIRTPRGLQVDLRVVPPDSWGAALIYFTGSQAHNIAIRERAARRGWTLNEYGLFEVEEGEPPPPDAGGSETGLAVAPRVLGRRLAGSTEEEVYEELGLVPVPAPLREDAGEVQAAEDAALPVTCTVEQLRGDLHVHTDASGDGRQSLEQVLDIAAARGWEYIAITDHAEELRMNGVSRAGMLAQRRRIRSLAERYPGLNILHGAELNIDAEGGLDYDPEFLASFDWGLASIHSHFDLDREQQTRRLVTAMNDPGVNAIGHLKGRRIGRRAGVDLDVEAILQAAETTRTAIEINSHLDRLDAPPEVLLAARGRDVLFVIDSDAHRPGEFDNLRHGVRLAQRGWVAAEQVVNTWSAQRFRAWVREKRASA